EVLEPVWRRGFEVIDVRTSPPPDVRGAAGFVITGSASNVPHRESWMLRAEGWLREVAASGTPTFGICLGHQLLRQALGGDVQKTPNGREIGTRTIERLADDPLFEGIPERFTANVTHIDSVRATPRDVVVLARSDLEAHHALRFSRTCYGVQFHPEI